MAQEEVTVQCSRDEALVLFEWVAVLAIALGSAGCSGNPERTLDNCGTTSGSGVPAFFQRYSECRVSG